MSDKSKIEWTDTTWNPILGCDKVSAGCKGCYAIRTAWRLQHNPNPKVAKAFAGLTKIEGGKPNWTGRVNFIPERLADPLGWKKPRRVFVNSQSDLFHEDVPTEVILKIFEVMAAAKQHTFQVLTKRPERMKHLLAYGEHLKCDSAEHHRLLCTMPLPNVWLGVSCENQATADERIPLLLQTPAAVRWISAEPLLARIEILVFLSKAMRGGLRQEMPGIDWVVAGGESGPDARPMHPDWARSLRDQCKAAGVPFFFKQWGEYAPYCSFGPITHIQDAGGGKWYVGSKSHTPKDRIVSHPVDGGTVINPSVPHFNSGNTAEIFRVGKKAAGRKLDGVEHSEYPVSAAEGKR